MVGCIMTNTQITGRGGGLPLSSAAGIARFWGKIGLKRASFGPSCCLFFIQYAIKYHSLLSCKIRLISNSTCHPVFELPRGREGVSKRDATYSHIISYHPFGATSVSIRSGALCYYQRRTGPLDTCQMGRLVRRRGGPPRRMLKDGVGNGG